MSGLSNLLDTLEDTIQRTCYTVPLCNFTVLSLYISSLLYYSVFLLLCCFVDGKLLLVVYVHSV